MSGIELTLRSRRSRSRTGRSVSRTIPDEFGKVIQVLKVQDEQPMFKPSPAPVDDVLVREDIPDIYDALRSYVSGPVDPDLLARYREDTLRQLRASKTTKKPQGCTFSDDDFMTVIRNISVYFFDGHLLGALYKIRPHPLQILHENQDPDGEECNGAPAVYMWKQNVIMQCCPKIDQMKPFLSFLDSTPIDDKNLNYSSPEHALLSLVEHELTHTLITNFFYTAKYNQSAHGSTFRLLSRNMFDHGWGDLAAAHLSMFAKNPARLSDHLDADSYNFDSEYKTEVLRRLEKWRTEALVPLRNTLIIGMVCLFLAAVLAMMGYRVYQTIEVSEASDTREASKQKNKQWLYILLFVLAGVMFCVAAYCLFQARDLITTQRMVSIFIFIIVGVGLVGGWFIGIML